MKKLPLRCGLCDCIIKEKSVEEHVKSREHQFRLNQLIDKMKENAETYGNPFIVDATKFVRENVDNPEKVDFT